MGKRRLTWLVLVFGVLLVAIFLIKDPLRRGIRYFYSEILFPPLRLSPENKTPPIILITVDTLRADHLGSYGYPRLTSPNIDSLAIDGITFEQAFTAVPKTSPSLASIMSGMYPRNHRIFTLKIEMNENLPTVPKILNERGYLTAGICGQINCDRRFGFARGFDYYFDDYKLDISEIEKYKPENGFSPVAERRAEDVINHAINWLDRKSVV